MCELLYFGSAERRLILFRMGKSHVQHHQSLFGSTYLDFE